MVVGEREDNMRGYGAYFCPRWCVQGDEEAGGEEHLTQGVEVQVERWGREVVRVRGTLGWDETPDREDGDTLPSRIDIDVSRADGGLLVLDLDGWKALNEAIENIYGDTLDDDWDNWRLAYSGAREDAVAAGWTVDDSMTED